MTLPRTTLGTSDLSIFPLNLGGNVFGWTADRQASFDILDAFTAGGGNFIDTADGYSAWVPGNTGRGIRAPHRRVASAPRQPGRARHCH
jgi:aryl-alcohol dehydrogenase-like predicted oxidoreductase